MNKQSPFTFIKAIHFFPRYASSVNNWARKVLGISGRNKPIEFTPEDKAAIKSGLHKMLKDFENW